VRKLDRVVELVGRLAAARAEVLQLEAELEALVGGGEQAEPAAKPTPPRNGHTNGKVKRGERQAQIIALAKEGVTDTAVIAHRLGINRKVAGIALWHARKAGLLPKARPHQ
jgi:hypothetical protein